MGCGPDGEGYHSGVLNLSSCFNVALPHHSFDHFTFLSSMMSLALPDTDIFIAI